MHIRLHYFLRMFVCVMGILLSLLSCNNELSPNGEWRDIPYLYAFLDVESDTQFVRVGRAYLAEEPPYVTARIKDSIYYDQLDIFLYELNENEKTYFDKLSYIEVPNRLKEGVFTNEGYHLYYTTKKIDPNKRYRIEFEKENGEFLWAETNIVHWTNRNNAFLAPHDGLRTLFLGHEAHRSSVVSWIEAKHALFYNCRIDFHYEEEDTLSGIRVEKIVDMHFHTPINEQNPVRRTQLMSWDEFVRLMQQRIEYNAAVRRYFKYLKVYVIGATEEIYTYSFSHGPAIGITQERYQYTNINNGVGIFSSVGRIQPISRETGEARTFGITFDSHVPFEEELNRNFYQN